MLPWDKQKRPDPIERQIPPEKVAEYRLVRGLIGLLDILAADILGPTEAEARLQKRRTR